MPAKKQKHINLLPKEDFERTTLGRVMKWALTSFRFIVIVVEFIVIAGFLFRFWLDVRISNLDDEITQKSALISSKSVFESDFRRAQNKVSQFTQITGEGNLSLPVIRGLTENLPPDSQIISLTRRRNSVEITAATVSETSISSYIANLKNTAMFSSITLSEITTEQGNPLIQYRLDIVLLEQV